MRYSLAQTLDLDGFSVLQANGLSQAKRSIRANFNGVILSDIRMPQNDGFDVLNYTQSIDPDLPLVMLTGQADVPMALRAMKAGAYDFLEKPCSTSDLLAVLHRALEMRKLTLSNRQMEQKLRRQDAASLHFPGASAPSAALRADLRRAAVGDVNIHLTGPVGVGKKLCAYTIHMLSQLRVENLSLNYELNPQLDIRKLAVPDVLCDLSLKNLHVTTDQQQLDLIAFANQHANLRIISSSPAPLETFASVSLIDALNPALVHVPSLEDRRADIITIFETFVRLIARGQNIDVPSLTPEIRDDVAARDWPGNLPQLRSYANSVVLGLSARGSHASDLSLADQMDAYEKLVLSETLKRYNGQASATAAALGLPRKTFYDRLTRHALRPKDFKSG